MKRQAAPQRQQLDPDLYKLICALADMQARADHAREMETARAAKKDQRQ
jgi:hypothetical protein